MAASFGPEVARLHDLRTLLVQLDVSMNRILDDILVCDNQTALNKFLQKARQIYTRADSQLETMELTAMQILDHRASETAQTEVEERRKQFKTLNQEIKVAVGQRMLVLERNQRRELIGNAADSASSSATGIRSFVKQEVLLQNNSEMTENLSRISRNIARQVEQSEDTIKTLVSSSETLGKTTDEFQNMGSHIQQGSRLIDKYDRRQLADKILIALAFAFYFLVCVYIINERLFGGFNWFSFFVEFFFPNQEESIDLMTQSSPPATSKVKDL
ncbi:hypothetical protein RvY_13833 [Ramazzottius varieornatus]|uniref:Sec20 C-terminal domain-containing protein n=1 Tax=Ramazzottius varieornatus TaxID=947166 RepID=A0A1D1VPA3_RAMVA|nr:hypothetical protein RvY_13833 [Ramazzottius varieornatus]